MLKLLSPGDWIADAVGLDDGENRQILRMFINTLAYGIVAVAVALAFA